MRLKVATYVLCIVLCLTYSGCATPVKVINFNDSEFYTETKDGVKYHCMSDYYVRKVLDARISKINPK